MTTVALAVLVLAALAALVAAAWRRRIARARWRVLRPERGRVAWRARVWPALPVRTGPAAHAFSGGVGFGLGYLLGGVIAGAALAAYAITGTVLLRRRARARDQTRARDEATEAVGALAADLRAGLPVGRALSEVEPVLDRARSAGSEAAIVAGRVHCAVTVAESSGAPLADVLDRLDGHLAAIGQARAAASAQAAGARASAVLLAGMPIAGLGLGGLIGVDPGRVLLRTPLGAGSFLLAVGLQLTGLAWSIRLARVEVAS